MDGLRIADQIVQFPLRVSARGNSMIRALGLMVFLAAPSFAEDPSIPLLPVDTFFRPFAYQQFVLLPK
jgi:hypothetical protein